MMRMVTVKQPAVVTVPPPAKASIDCLPDVVWMRILELLGTPVAVDDPDHDEDQHYLNPMECVSDVCAMSQVCHRWKKMVRSSELWKESCEWRWPWMTTANQSMVDRVLFRDPR